MFFMISERKQVKKTFGLKKKQHDYNALHIVQVTVNKVEQECPREISNHAPRINK